MIRKLPNEKISRPIIAFSMFMALMLFQTSYMRLGTTSAMLTLGATVLLALIEKRGCVSASRRNITIVSFLVIVTVVTVVRASIPSYYVRFAAQIVLFVVISEHSLTEKENNYLKITFIIATAFYAILTIYSCFRYQAVRYYHGNILLFNTELDPNFIGIPFVACIPLLFEKIESASKKILWIAFLVVILAAIVLTASRGNMLGAMIAILLSIWFFLTKKNVAMKKKILFVVLLAVFMRLLITYFSLNFARQWDRITTFGENADNGRFILWGRAIELWEDHFILGGGLSSILLLYGKATHNTYLQLLSETGTFGLICFLYIFISLLRKTFRSDKALFVALLTFSFQIAFLDALDNRCLWIILAWLSMSI